MSDAAVQRNNMVESQVRPSDVTDRRVLRVMSAVAREAFVPPALRALAYADAELPLGAPNAGGPKRAMLSPRVLGKLLQLAALDAGGRVLDVGVGTGYSAAVIASIATSVVALECDGALAAHAKAALAEQSIANVAVIEGPLAKGHPAGGPYDVIVLEGAVPGDPPAGLVEQLRDGGRMVGIRAAGRSGKAVLWQKVAGRLSVTVAFDASAPLLPGFEPAQAFVF